jgi:hypothetical protein
LKALTNSILTPSASLPAKDARAVLTELIAREQKDFSPQKDLRPETKGRNPSRGEASFPINQPRK